MYSPSINTTSLTWASDPLSKFASINSTARRVLSKPQAVNLWIDQEKKLLAFSKGELLYLTENNDLLRPGEKHPEDATDPTREQEELPWHATVYVQYPMVKEVYGQSITTLEAYKEALDAFLSVYGNDEKKYAISYDKDSAGDILWLYNTPLQLERK